MIEWAEKFILLVQLALGFEWLRSGLEKILAGTFPATLQGALRHLLADNPHKTYRIFQEKILVPYARPLGFVTMWFQFLAGLTLIVAVPFLWAAVNPADRQIAAYLSIFALAGLGFLNANFWFAAGWSNVSTNQLNTLMLWLSVILIYFLAFGVL